MLYFEIVLAEGFEAKLFGSDELLPRQHGGTRLSVLPVVDRSERDTPQLGQTCLGQAKCTTKLPNRIGKV